MPFSSFTTLCILFGTASFRCFLGFKTFAWRMKTALITSGFLLLLIHKAVSSGLGAGCLQVGWEDGINLSYWYEFSFV